MSDGRYTSSPACAPPGSPPRPFSAAAWPGSGGGCSPPSSPGGPAGTPRRRPSTCAARSLLQASEGACGMLQRGRTCGRAASAALRTLRVRARCARARLQVLQVAVGGGGRAAWPAATPPRLLRRYAGAQVRLVPCTYPRVRQSSQLHKGGSHRGSESYTRTAGGHARQVPGRQSKEKLQAGAWDSNFCRCRLVLPGYKQLAARTVVSASGCRLGSAGPVARQRAQLRILVLVLVGAATVELRGACNEVKRGEAWRAGAVAAFAHRTSIGAPSSPAPSGAAGPAPGACAVRKSMAACPPLQAESEHMASK